MTPTEAARALDTIQAQSHGNREVLHLHADRLVAEVLRTAGYAELADRYASMIEEEFWYG